MLPWIRHILLGVCSMSIHVSLLFSKAICAMLIGVRRFTLRKHIGLNPAGKVHLFVNELTIVTLHTIAAWPLTSPAGKTSTLT